MITIAIDYDKTWTADTELWQWFVRAAEDRGHRVVMVTGRRAWSDDMSRGGIPSTVRIIFSGDEMKEKAARLAGERVNVWIDDMPGVIQSVGILPGRDEQL
jgi:hypothetical protein